MATSKMLSPLTITDPRVLHPSVPRSALLAPKQQHTPEMSEYTPSRTEAAALIPQRTLLPMVDEEGSTTTEDKPAEAALEKKGTGAGSSDTGSKSGSEASYNGKRDPFAGDGGGGGGMQYRTMAWWYVTITKQAGMLMVAETISLGVLSLPAALSTLGIIPGLILIVSLGILASYTGYVIGQFKIRYRHVHSMADAGEMIFGSIGRELLGFGQLFFIVFIMAAHILSFSIMMNAITSHGTCTVVFMIVGTIVSLIFTLPRTLGNLSYYCIASFASVIAAVLVTMIGVSVTKPGLDPASHMQKIDLFPRANVRFHEGFLAMTNIVFAYAGHVAFFTFISELREPKDFPKALALLQCSDIAMYIVASVVIYYYAGTHVASPALDSATPIIRKVAYGVAMPTIVIAGVVNGHVAVKYLYVRLFRNSHDDIMHQRTFKAYGLWVLICAVLWTTAWVIAEGIPVFNDLLGITGALFASWFTYGVSGILWLQMNMEKRGWKMAPTKGWTWRKTALFVVNWGNILIGLTICVVGLYASGKSISINTVKNKPFTCGDNSAAKTF